MALDLFSSLFLTEWGRVIQRIQVLYYFREVLFVEAEILVVSVFNNLPVTNVDRKLYSLPLFKQNVN